jgi:hypothetical protein
MIRPVTHELAADVAGSVEGLEQRVSRLEDAFAALQDTQLMEDRVVERVAQRLESARPAFPDARGLIVDAPRMLPPRMVEPFLEDGSGADAGNDGAAAAAVGSTWLLLDVVREFRLIVRMLMDYRYRMTWTGRVVPLVALGIVFFSWVLIGGRFLYLGDWVDKVIDAVLVVVVYKVLGREARRYQELLARVSRYR